MARTPTDTKSKLLFTANELISQSSYGFVSVDDICKAANVKKGSFYHYFSSKAELAVAAMEASYKLYELELNNVLSTTFSPIERLENLAEFIYQAQKQSFEKYGRVCGCPYASLGSEMAGNEELIQKKADEILHLQANMFNQTLQEMVHSELLPKNTDIANMSAQIITTILGQVMVARIQNNLTNLKKDIRLSLFHTLGLEPHISGINTMPQEHPNGE